MALMVSKLVQFSGHVVGSILGRWRQNPRHVFSDLFMLVSFTSARLKYIPYSNKIRLVFGSNGDEKPFADFLWNEFLRENESKILDPGSPKVRRVTRVLVKIIQALSDGLMLQHDCSVSTNGDYKNKQIIVSSWSRGSRGPPEHNFEHLDGRNWEVVVLESEVCCDFYHAGHGRIVMVLMDSNRLDLYDSEDKLANDLAHEVGHEVAMHPQGNISRIVFPFALVPWTSALWGPAMFIRLFDLFLYGVRRLHWTDVDQLMASAGYDPIVVPEIWRQRQQQDDSGGIYLDTFHPCSGRRAEMMSQATVMDRAIQICKQVRGGHGVPCFIEKAKAVLFNPNFNPFYLPTTR